MSATAVPTGIQVFNLCVHGEVGQPTEVHASTWKGTRGASTPGGLGGPNPIEALMGAVAGCILRSLAPAAEAASVSLERVVVAVTATRTSDPPAITALEVDVALDADAEPGVLRGLVESAVRRGPITRLVARGCPLTVRPTFNGEKPEVPFHVD